MSIRRLNSVIALVAAALMGMGLGAAWGQTEDELIARAREAIGARDPSAALDALAAADQVRGKDGGYTAHFLRGAAWQDRAKTAPDDGARAQMLTQARESYTRALGAATPGTKRGPVLNNLAMLAASQGDDGAARRWFEAAIKERDERVDLYAMNFVRYLEPRDGDTAKRIAADAIKASPGNAAMRTKLAKLYARSPVDDRLVPFLTRSVQDGFTFIGTSVALEELAAGTLIPVTAREQLMVVVAIALASEAKARPNGFDAQSAKDILPKLDALAIDPLLGSAAQQLRRVLVTAPSGYAELSWWNRRSPTVGALATSPKSAMRELLIAQGIQHGARDLVQAERWLRASVDAGDQGADPDAFLRVVELYVNTNQVYKLKPLMDRYEGELFSEKSNAYLRGDWPSIYRLHLALGMTYAEMKVWKSNTPFQNAVFQLSNASKAADQLNKMPPNAGQPPQRVVLPSAAALKLSEGYVAVGQPEQAARIKLDTAVKLLEAQRATESRDLLKTLEPHEVGNLNAADKSKYIGLKAAVKG